MPTNDDSEMQVRFYGAATDGNSVPVDILTTSLGSLQKLVHLLAAGLAGPDEMGGATVPVAIKRRYALLCRLPESGSLSSDNQGEKPPSIKVRKPNSRAWGGRA